MSSETENTTTAPDQALTEVFLVELRENHPGNEIWECTIMYTASSLDKAITWSQEHVHEIITADMVPSLLAITRDQVDGDGFCSLVKFISKNGIASDEAPDYFFDEVEKA